MHGFPSLLYVLALGALVVVCVGSVLNPDYDDTLTQRVALSAVGLGAIAEIYHTVEFNNEPSGVVLMIAGGLVFAGATLRKRLILRQDRRPLL